MKMNRPQILISNDDGVNAKGIRELINYLRPVGDLIVMAPDSARSGMACALTADRPLHYTLVSKEEGLTIYKCTGTPVDCIKLACYELDINPDLIVAGINHGDNSGVNVHYSGTMGVVIEGCLRGIPSVGYSLCDHDPDADFTHGQAYIAKIAQTVIEKGLPDRVCLNVNYPQGELKGIRICQQAVGRWENEFERRRRPHGSDYFWLTGDFVCHTPDDDASDHWALANGFMAITPVNVDMTAYGMIDQLKSWNL